MAPAAFYRVHQLRLEAKIGKCLDIHLQETTGYPLLDVGCGRGGPAVDLANEFGFDVIGVDLVPFNTTQAVQNANKHDADAQFVVGDATALPFDAETMTACTAIDSLVYVPDRNSAVSEIADVLTSTGVVVISNLLRRIGGSEQGQRAVERFADEWDMPPLGTEEEYEQMLVDVGFSLQRVEDITASSVGRFRKWTTLFLGLVASPARPLITYLLQQLGLDTSALPPQVRVAHQALPHLKHVVYIGRT
ncbi:MULTISPECIES: class I SAM-dependent methyltransferase [Haloferacaceae]|uniref:class I SAM-dependent methyltransferase n=1 Tax=Haloferacaceae TaxID=1644056 RepID=UPI001F4495CB|nr:MULTISPECIES: class I SAM-dependent methyltransferase [Haloferacaceae]